MNNSFCTNCGNTLSPGVRFCGKCGTPAAVVAAPATTVPPVAFNTPSPVSEQAYTGYKFIVPATYKKGLVSMKGCTLIFSENEIVTAFVDNKLMQQHIAQIKESVKGEKLLKRTAAVMKAGFSYTDRYWNMPVDQIMAENSGNFLINNNTVNQVKFQRGSVGYNYDNTTTNVPPSLSIKCTEGKYNYTMNSGFDSKTFISVLQSLFPGQYKGPKR